MLVKWNPYFSNLQGKNNGSKNGQFEKSGVKLQLGHGTTFWFELSRGSRNRFFTKFDLVQLLESQGSHIQAECLFVCSKYKELYGNNFFYYYF